MIPGRLRYSADEGESLVELIVTITIIGAVAIAAGSGIALSIVVSDQHQKQATANYLLHNLAESLQSTPYQPCTASSTPDYTAGLPKFDKFSAPTQGVKFWNGTAFVPSCPLLDKGLQQVTLTLASTDKRAEESIVVVVRRP